MKKGYVYLLTHYSLCFRATALSLSLNSKMELLAMHCRGRILFITYRGKVEEVTITADSATLDPGKESLYYIVNQAFYSMDLEPNSKYGIAGQSNFMVNVSTRCSRKMVAVGNDVYGIGAATIDHIFMTTGSIMSKPLDVVGDPDTIKDVHICAIP